MEQISVRWLCICGMHTARVAKRRLEAQKRGGILTVTVGANKLALQHGAGDEGRSWSTQFDTFLVLADHYDNNVATT
ncbi:hypothetical protein J5J83_16130 [Azoarcus sp. L1K30]|uniref:hypothetical protein n=1 Tax=Azoarcus sp. L1K30 TaxID=2820277 RepID=UPI001B837841|nr:hypothetical protein [Azoarcus sp. L1K30]MBR0567653.1 hypothetical protein [Azoarcus sp. L1K30]